PGGIGLRWAADDYLIFMSDRDGFPHLYSVQHPAPNSRPTLLTAGSFMVDQVTMSQDGRWLVYNANTGPDRSDIDRRHLFKVAVTGGAPVPLTPGTGIDWNPAVPADGQSIAFLGSTAQKPPQPAVIPMAGGPARAVAANRLAADYPSAQLVTPELVAFRASDGVEAHGQLFKPTGGDARKPAVIYIHGGGPRQMLLGFHNRWEYANDYAANEYLVSRGF